MNARRRKVASCYLHGYSKPSPIASLLEFRLCTSDFCMPRLLLVSAFSVFADPPQKLMTALPNIFRRKSFLCFIFCCVNVLIPDDQRQLRLPYLRPRLLLRDLPLPNALLDLTTTHHRRLSLHADRLAAPPFSVRRINRPSHTNATAACQREGDFRIASGNLPQHGDCGWLQSQLE
jgi:hypothetical protein